MEEKLSFGEYIEKFSRNDQALELFKKKKFTRTEGLVVEHELQQVLLSRLKPEGWMALDGLVVKRRNEVAKTTELIIYLHDKSQLSLLKAVIPALRKTGMTVRYINEDAEGNLCFYHNIKGRYLEKTQREIIGPQAELDTKDAVTDQARVKSIFWGFASHVPGLVTRFVKELILKDVFLNEKGAYLVDIDTLLVSPEGQLCYLEVKHKYPMWGGSYGLNLGQFMTMKEVYNAGIKVFHIILKKPFDNPDKSSMYLYFDRELRERAIWLGVEITAEMLKEAGKKLLSGGRHTSIGGNRKQKFYMIPSSAFAEIGKNSQTTDDLAAGLLKLLKT